MLRREGTAGSHEEVRGVREDWEREEDRVSREESRVNRGTSSQDGILTINFEASLIYNSCI